MKFKSKVTFIYDEKNVANAKSVLSVLGACIKSGDEIELLIGAEGAGDLDTGGLQLLADMPAASVGADIECREPRGEILPGFGVIVPEGDHADGRAVFLSDEHLRHAAPPHGVARAVDDILEAVAVGPGPLLPEPAGDLLHMLRRVGQIPDMNYTHLHALLRLFSSV